MNRKEAIMHIDGMINTAIIVKGIVPDEYDMEALRMAVDALSGESKALPSAEAKATMTEEVREALMRLVMCAREECDMCKYKYKCGFEFQYNISTENMHTILDALSAEATCETCADRALCIMSAPDGKWKACKDYRPQVETVHKPDYSYEADMVKRLRQAEAVQRWIPFTRRPMTEEEQKDYPNCTFMFDCVLPDDGDEILVSNGRFVWMDAFCNDIDGCYLDSGDDIDEDMAWMPLPKPYKGGDAE